MFNFLLFIIFVWVVVKLIKSFTHSHNNVNRYQRNPPDEQLIDAPPLFEGMFKEMSYSDEDKSDLDDGDMDECGYFYDDYVSDEVKVEFRHRYNNDDMNSVGWNDFVLEYNLSCDEDFFRWAARFLENKGEDAKDIMEEDYPFDEEDEDEEVEEESGLEDYSADDSDNSNPNEPKCLGFCMTLLNRSPKVKEYLYASEEHRTIFILVHYCNQEGRTVKVFADNGLYMGKLKNPNIDVNKIWPVLFEKRCVGYLAVKYSGSGTCIFFIKEASDEEWNRVRKVYEKVTR